MSKAPPEPATVQTLCLHGVFLALKVPAIPQRYPQDSSPKSQSRSVAPSTLSLPASMPEAPSGVGHQEADAPEASFTSVGVLILGSAGIGKSELALDLISRGHALVADDVPLFRPAPDGRWLGRCPAPLQGFLEVRSLGILNVRRLFGEQAICVEHPLDLVIRLEAAPSGPEDRLVGAWREYRLGETLIPELPLTAHNGRNLTLLVETAARLRACGAGEGIGYNAASELSRRLEEHLGKESL